MVIDDHYPNETCWDATLRHIASALHIFNRTAGPCSGRDQHINDQGIDNSELKRELPNLEELQCRLKWARWRSSQKTS